MSRGQFYLDKANGKLWGVCAGIADYTGISAFWVRIIAVVLTLIGFTLTIPVYIAVALIADKRPLHLYSDREEEELLRKAQRRNPSAARHGRMRGTLTDMDRRVADLEAYYRRSNPRLAAEIDTLR